MVVTVSEFIAVAYMLWIRHLADDGANYFYQNAVFNWHCWTLNNILMPYCLFLGDWGDHLGHTSRVHG